MHELQEYDRWGCMDTVAINYVSQATRDDGSCIMEGCVDPGCWVSVSAAGRWASDWGELLQAFRPLY